MSEIIIAGIMRAGAYSPNHIGNDAAIFNATADQLRKRGCAVNIYSEDQFNKGLVKERIILNMCREQASIKRLQQLEDDGCIVVNSGYGIENCTRERMTRILLGNNIPYPDSVIVNTDEAVVDRLKQAGINNCWIKRGDFHAMHKEDVSYVRHAEEAQEVLQEYFYRGIRRAVINRHLVGDLIKFYGMRGSTFFYWFYPFDDGHSKYGLEAINGKSKGLDFDIEQLEKSAPTRPKPSALTSTAATASFLPQAKYASSTSTTGPVSRLAATKPPPSSPNACLNSSKQIKTITDGNQQQKVSYKDTLKSMDTEETIDLCFYRPIGYMWAVLCAKAGIKPNAITIASIFIGIAAGVLFYFDELWINVVGMLMLVWANSFDSADGQLARMTGQYSRLGRILDGLSGDFWFVAIYFAICFRVNATSEFFGDYPWLIWVIAIAAGACHAKQAAAADYYRQFHLYFLKGKEGSELDSVEQIDKAYAEMKWKGNFWKRQSHSSIATTRPTKKCSRRTCKNFAAS